jgi:periplasmic protein TonB
MPADLFRPNVIATSSRRRASLLPVSIALHVVAIAAFFIVPLLADVELPPPNQRVATPYIQVLPIAPPIAVRSKPATTQPVPSAAPMAPLTIPDSIPPEHEITTMGDPLPGADIGFTEGVDPGVLIPGEAPSPPPPAPRAPVKVGGSIQAPRKIVNVAPLYPAIAQSSRVQGKVVLEALIGVDGHVDRIRVLEPAPLLTDAAITAVRQWVFTPTKLNGEPVQVIMTVTVDFRLQ